MRVKLPLADEPHIGSLIAVRWDPGSNMAELYVSPSGQDTINDVSSFNLSAVGQCALFIVGDVGKWWIVAEYEP